MPTSSLSWPGVLASLLRGDALDAAAASWAMDEIMAGNATPAQIAAFAVLLRAKGETAAELGGWPTRCASERHR